MAGFGDFLKGAQSMVANPMFAAGASIYSGGSPAQAFGQMQQSQALADQQRQQAEQKAAWQKFAQSGQAPAGVQPFLPFIGPEAGASALMTHTLNAPKYAQASETNRLQNELTKARIRKLMSGGGEGSAKYGKTGAIFENNGQMYSVQFADDGTRKIAPLQQGMVPANLSPTLQGNKTTAIEDAKSAAKGKDTLNGVLQMAKIIVPNIDAVLKHDRLGAVTGWSRNLPTIRNDTSGLEQRINQLDGSTLLQGIQYLRGTGAISDYEGGAAKSAVARMSTAQSKQDYQTALNDYRSVVLEGVRQSYIKAGVPVPANIEQELGGQASGAPAKGGWSIQKVQ